jgi:hypothetical protein
MLDFLLVPPNIFILSIFSLFCFINFRVEFSNSHDGALIGTYIFPRTRDPEEIGVEVLVSNSSPQEVEAGEFEAKLGYTVRH